MSGLVTRQTGFARYPGESMIPNRRARMLALYAPHLGADGLRVQDYGGRKWDGVVTGMAPATDWVATEKGATLRFVAADAANYILLPQAVSAALGDWTAVTIACLVRRTVLLGAQHIINLYRAAGNAKLNLSFDNANSLTLGARSGLEGLANITTAATFTDLTAWLWIVGICNLEAKTAALTVNGRIEATGAGMAWANGVFEAVVGGVDCIGAASGAAGWLNGEVALVALWAGNQMEVSKNDPLDLLRLSQRVRAA